MSKIRLFVLAVLVAAMSIMPQQMAAAIRQVKTIELKNYFHNSGTPLPSSPLVTTQADFDHLFSPAAVMGNDGEPTAVNFRKQAVLAIVLPVTNRCTEISAVTVTEVAKNRLRLAYTVHYGERQSYTTQPIRLLAVDGRYRKATVDVKATVVDDPETVTADYRNTHYLDRGRQLDISLDYPLAGGDIRNAVVDYEASVLNGVARSISWSDDTTAVAPAYKGDVAKMFRDAITRLTDSMNVVDKANGTPAMPCSVQLKIVRTDEGDRYLTLTTSGYVFTGGAHGSSIDRGITFDKTTGQPAALVRDCPALRKLIQEKLPAGVRESFSADNLVPFPENAPYYQDGCVMFVYQSDEIAAHAVGKVVVTFWPVEIEQFLTDEFRHILND